MLILLLVVQSHSLFLLFQEINGQRSLFLQIRWRVDFSTRARIERRVLAMCSILVFSDPISVHFQQVYGSPLYYTSSCALLFQNNYTRVFSVRVDKTQVFRP